VVVFAAVDPGKPRYSCRRFSPFHCNSRIARPVSTGWMLVPSMTYNRPIPASAMKDEGGLADEEILNRRVAR
jgi:hypothetical protein